MTPQEGRCAVCKQDALAQPIRALGDLRRGVTDTCTLRRLPWIYGRVSWLVIDVVVGCSPTRGGYEDMEGDVDSRRSEGSEGDDTCLFWEFFKGMS